MNILTAMWEFAIGFLQVMQTVYAEVLKIRTLNFYLFGTFVGVHPAPVYLVNSFGQVTSVASADFHVLWYTFSPITHMGQGFGWAYVTYEANILAFMLGGFALAFVGVIVWNIVKKVVV